MSQNVIEELKAKYEAGTSGPWRWEQGAHRDATRYLVSDDAAILAQNDLIYTREEDEDLIVAMHRHLPALLDLAQLAAAAAPQLRAAERVLYKRWLAANDDITHRAWADAQKIALGLEEALSRLNATDEGKTR